MSSASAVENSKPRDEVRDGGSPLRSLSLGWLAMLPLFVVYELALLHDGASRRNTGELALGLALGPLGEQATHARWISRMSPRTVSPLVPSSNRNWVALPPNALR